MYLKDELNETKMSKFCAEMDGKILYDKSNGFERVTIMDMLVVDENGNEHSLSDLVYANEIIEAIKKSEQ